MTALLAQAAVFIMSFQVMSTITQSRPSTSYENIGMPPYFDRPIGGRHQPAVDTYYFIVGLLNPLRDKKMKARTGEGTTPVTTACPEAAR